MPFSMCVSRWVSSSGGMRVRCALPHHTLHPATLSLAGMVCRGDRGLTTPMPHPVIATHPYSTNRIPSDGENKTLSSLSPEIDGKLGAVPPNPSTLREEQGPLSGLGATGGLTGPLVVSRDGMKKAEDWNDILNRWYQQYQDFVGITDLKRAQDRVTELSEGLLAAQGERRRLQAEIEELQARLVENHHGITKTEQYSQEHMRLFSEARELNDKLRTVRSQFTQYEQTERDTFTHLSAAIRDCHERERMQAEQSKYWSIIASVVSALLASVITSINNWVRIREIKEHVTTSQQTLLEGYQQMHTDILASLDTQARQGQAVTSGDLQDVTKQLTSISKLVTDNISKATEGLVSSVTAALTAATREEAARVVPPPPPADNAVVVVSGGGGGDVSYPRVAATMLVGAALGTLVTAFFLGALGGSGG